MGEGLIEVKAEVRELDGLLREIAVVVPVDIVNDEMEKGFAAARREATLKGYRKGKAPISTIKSLFADKVKADSIDALVRSTFPDAVKEKTLKVASTPSLTNLEFDDHGNLCYRMQVEVFPEFDEVIVDNLELPTEELEVSDEETDKVAQQYRHQFSELRPVDHAATAADVVSADMKKIDDPRKAIDQTEFAGAVIDLASEATLREFREQIPGMQTGEEKEIKVEYSEENSNPKLAGASVTYRCLIKEVKERILPELNDAFAKSTGRAETAQELKLKIREDILSHKGEELRRLQRRELVRSVCKQNQIPIPDGMVNNYLDAVVEDLKKQDPDANEQEIRTQYRPVGVNSMRWEILWHRLAEVEKIEVLPADTEKWIETFSAANKLTQEQAEQVLYKSGRLEQLRESIREEKVLDYLMSRARPKAISS